MVVYKNQKYACLNCLRGHRASSCDHKYRILLQVGKRGRRPQAEANSRLALVRNQNVPDEQDGKEVPPEAIYKVIRVSVPEASPTALNAPSKVSYGVSKEARICSDLEHLEKWGLNKIDPTYNSKTLVSAPSLDSGKHDMATVKQEFPTLNQLESADQISADDDNVVFTEKYVFIHVGGNLFRREARPGISKQKLTTKGHTTRQQNTDLLSQFDKNPMPLSHYDGTIEHYKQEPHAFPLQDVSTHQSSYAGDDIPMASLPDTKPDAKPLNPSYPLPFAPMQMQPNDLAFDDFHHRDLLASQIDATKIGLANASHSSSQSSLEADNISTSHTSSTIYEAQKPLTSNVSEQHRDAPLVIAPMQYQVYGNQGPMNLLNKIGISSEEASQLWPPGKLNNMNLLYAPDCAFQGHCKCGDKCKCPDCYDHHHKQHQP